MSVLRFSFPPSLVLLLASGGGCANTPPRIDSIYAEDGVVHHPGSTEVHAEAVDDDGDALEYHWAPSACGISGSGPDVVFDTSFGDVEPCHAGEAVVELTVSDGRGGEDVARLYIQVEF